MTSRRAIMLFAWLSTYVTCPAAVPTSDALGSRVFPVLPSDGPMLKQAATSPDWPITDKREQEPRPPHC